jgi:hypothetical protein
LIVASFIRATPLDLAALDRSSRAKIIVDCR